MSCLFSHLTRITKIEPLHYDNVPKIICNCPPMVRCKSCNYSKENAYQVKLAAKDEYDKVVKKYGYTKNKIEEILNS